MHIKSFEYFLYIYLPGFMKTRVSKHFVISLNFPRLMACLLSCLLMPYFLFVLWLGLCVDVAAVDRISRISIYPPLIIIITFIYTRQKHQAKYNIPSFFFFILPTILS